jgi:molybdopterin-guanine dinucleotide biosynthesis protein A
VPFLQPAFIRRLFELLGDHHICVPRVDELHHPLAAVYRLEVLPHVRELLDENRLRPVYLFEKSATRIVGEEELIDVDPKLRSLCNLNTPEEYEAALRDDAATRA